MDAGADDPDAAVILDPESDAGELVAGGFRGRAAQNGVGGEAQCHVIGGDVEHAVAVGVGDHRAGRDADRAGTTDDRVIVGDGQDRERRGIRGSGPGSVWGRALTAGKEQPRSGEEAGEAGARARTARPA